jgi:hypothetical protein
VWCLRGFIEKTRPSPTAIATLHGSTFTQVAAGDGVALLAGAGPIPDRLGALHAALLWGLINLALDPSGRLTPFGALHIGVIHPFSFGPPIGRILAGRRAWTKTSRVKEQQDRKHGSDTDRAATAGSLRYLDLMLPGGSEPRR